MELESKIFDYLDEVREDRGIKPVTLARELWPDISVNAASARYSRLKGMQGIKRQRVTLEDIDAMCKALNLDIASVLITVRERERLLSRTLRPVEGPPHQ